MNWNGLELPDKNVYFKDDDSLIYCADCRDILPLIPDKSIDLALTSPPYNFDAGSGIGHKYDFNTKGYKDNYTQGEYYLSQSKVVERLLCVSPLLFYNIQMVAGNKDAFLRLLGSHYKVIKEIIIWDKINAEPAINDKVLNSQFEFIIVFSDSNRRKFDKCYFPQGTLSNIWHIGKNVKNQFSGINLLHSAIVNPALASKIIINFTTAGNLILDPFLGSGTTAYCAKKLGRKCIGIEIEEKYCEIAKKRLAQSVMRLECPTT